MAAPIIRCHGCGVCCARRRSNLGKTSTTTSRHRINRCSNGRNEIVKVAFIGLGVVRYPMAGHLSEVGHEVAVYNRTAAKAAK